MLRVAKEEIFHSSPLCEKFLSSLDRRGYEQLKEIKTAQAKPTYAAHGESKLMVPSVRSAKGAGLGGDVERKDARRIE